MKKKPDRVWVEINLDYIAHNYKQIKEYVGENVLVNAIIKADGYGHGSIETAKILCESNVDMLSTATLDEAIQLRKKKIDKPILVLGYVDSERIDEILENDIIVSVFSGELAINIAEAAKLLNRKIKVHIKVDTGMNRIGFNYENIDEILSIMALDNLEVEGLFTHFSKADEKDSSYTNIQYNRFIELIKILEENGHNIPLKHACNSGGIILHSDKHLNMVRPGIILFGLYPSPYSESKSKLDLKPAMAFKSRVIKIKEIEKGQAVSYGGNYITSEKTKVATIACGYADGFSRQLSSKIKVLVNQKKAPVIGNICMDMCMINVNQIEVKEKDEVTLFNEVLRVEDIALICQTLNYEIVCKIGMRVPRVYLKNNKIVKIQNYLVQY